MSRFGIEKMKSRIGRRGP